MPYVGRSPDGKVSRSFASPQPGLDLEYLPDGHADLPPLLPHIKAQLLADLAAEAEARRLRIITGGASQAMIYIGKEHDAKEVLTKRALNPLWQPKAVDYPLLAAGLGIDGPDLVKVAENVAATALAWRTIAGAIDRTRRLAAAAIEAATTIQQARAIAQSVTWPES